MPDKWRHSKLRNEPQASPDLPIAPSRMPERSTCEVWQRPKTKGPATRRSLRTRRANRRKHLQEDGYL